MEQENNQKRKQGRPAGRKNKKKLPMRLEEDKLIQIYKISSILRLFVLENEASLADKEEKSLYKLAIMEEHIQYQLINLALSLDKEKEVEKDLKIKYMWFILNRP